MNRRVNNANVSVTIDEDKAYYNGLFGAIDAEYLILTAKRELNYIIPNAEALQNIPTNASYLVFSEDIELPTGWTYEETERGILVLNQVNDTIYLYESPHSTDAETMALREENTIFEAELNGTFLTIKTKVKTEWLLSEERVFPVKVDPTVSVYPNNAANWSKSVYSDGDAETAGYFGFISGTWWLRYHIKFNATSIPQGSTINSVIGYIYFLYGTGSNVTTRQWQFANSADPTITSGLTLYNSANLEYSDIVQVVGLNYRYSTFYNPQGNTYVKNGIDNNGYVNMSVVPSGSYSGTTYFQVGNHTASNSNKPYLYIDYTVPASAPSCATIIGPPNGSTDAAHQGDIAWNSVAGATGYDVYFGTSPTPPLVSSNQVGTTYTVPSCLAPETTYYWKVVPKNANGSATGCPTWSFTTDNKLHLYKNNFDDANEGYFGTSGASVDGWYANNTSGITEWGVTYANLWTVGSGPYAINGKSIGVTALQNGGLAADHFMYWNDLGELHRWIYRPFDMSGIRDIELNFNWKCGGESNQDYGSVATSINGGANWLTDEQGGLYSDGRYWNSSSIVRNQTIVFPNSRNNQSNFQLAFKWDDQSGNGVSGYPSFVVDDIIVKGCPYEGSITSTSVSQGVYEWEPSGSTQTTLSINNTHECAYFQWEQSTNDGASWSDVVGGSGGTIASYTTPNDLTEDTWYRCKVYFGSGCQGVYQDEVFKILFPSFDCNEVSNLTVDLGDPFNGLEHHLDVSWDAFSGATGYDVQYSTDNITFNNASPFSVTTNSYDFNAGDNPNAPYWFKVRAKDDNETCDWTDVGPIYTACDVPEEVSISNVGGSSMEVTLQAETPVENPSYTKYSIYCPTTGQYVQTDGSLGATEVFQTKTNWGTVIVIGLDSETEYCFVANARNEDGHIVEGNSGGGSSNNIIIETFDSNVLTTNTGVNNWYAPDYYTPITWNNTEGCPSGGGSIGYSGNWNNFWGNFVRLPEQDLSGLDEVVMTFDLTNSFSASAPNNNFRLYIHDGNSYLNPPTIVEVGGNTYTQQGINNYFYLFDVARTCEEVTVTYDLSGVANKSNLLFYIEVNSGYNNSTPFFFYIDNITLTEASSSPSSSNCATTAKDVIARFHNFGGADQIAFDNIRATWKNPKFRISHTGGDVSEYEIEMSETADFSSNVYTQVFDDGIYEEDTEMNFQFTQLANNMEEGKTYYARVRAKGDATGAYGSWTTKTHSFTYSYIESDIPSWFQTTTPQFLTDELDGTETVSDYVKIEGTSGGGTFTNPFTDPSFETGAGWSVSQSYSVYETYLTSNDNGTNGITDGSNCVKFAEDDYSWQSFYNGEYNNVSQQVDLTGVGSIEFDITHWRNTQSQIYNCNVGRACKVVWSFQVIIGDAGTSGDNSGILVYNWTPTTAEFETTNNNDVLVDLTSYGFTGVKTVKFSRVVTDGGGVWYDDDKYYLDNIRAYAAPVQLSGTITSTPIRLASVQGATGFEDFIWSQEIHSSIEFDFQHYNTSASSWQNISGFTGISNPSTGTHTHPLGFSYDSIRVVGHLDGSTDLKMLDWEISFLNGNPLPVELVDFRINCEDNQSVIYWETASEHNSESFIVEYSGDGENWREVEIVSGAGNISTTSYYTVNGVTSQNGLAYYRLIQRDYDGKEKIYGPISSTCDNNNNEWTLYPNPNDGQFNISISSSIKENSTLAIFDAQGRVVYNQDIQIGKGKNLYPIQQKLIKGVYFVSLKESKNNYKPIKFVVN